MFVHHRSQGLILKKRNVAEADQLFIVYSKEFGKLEVLGRGIRKISSKLRPGMETFCLSEIEFIQGKTYKTLTDAILTEKFKNLRKDLAKLSIAYKITGVLHNLIHGQEPDQRLWNLLLKIFERLNGSSFKIKNPELIYYYFLWNVFSILGYEPELYHCSSCQGKLKPKNLYFIPKEGGVVCQNCFKKEQSGKRIEPEIVKILRIIIGKGPRIISRIKVEREHLKALKRVSGDYLSFVPEKSN